MSTETTWRYEIRGSSVWDNEEGKALSIFEAADRLNEETRLHQVNLIRAGTWAAKAGLADARAKLADAFYREWRGGEPLDRVLMRFEEGYEAVSEKAT